MGKALYRKYRPTTLDEVIGQDEIIQSLQSAIKTNKISHAYLFSGPRGTGKTSVARIFAHAINQFDYQLEDSYLDIIEIDAASNTGVDNIRELREKAIIAPTKGKFKVYIIDEIHMLSRGAFNALLKLLEEPPAHIVFIMATTEPHKVLDTIRSRSQSFTFHLANQPVMVKYLSKIIQQEKIDCEKNAVELIAKRSGGSFRDALSLLDQIAVNSKKITQKSIEQALGLPSLEIVNSLIEGYLSDPSGLSTKLQVIFTSDIKPKILLTELIEYITKNPQPELLNLLSRLTEIDAPFIEAKLLVAFMSDSIPNPKSTSSLTTPPKTISPNTPTAKQTSTPKTAEPAKSLPTNDKVINEAPFDWEQFVSEIRQINVGIAKYLTASKYEIKSNAIHIYPEKSFAKTLLSRENNLALLRKHAKNHQIALHDPIKTQVTSSKSTSINTTAKSTQNSSPSTLQKISGIMGSIQEVIDDSEVPF